MQRWADPAFAAFPRQSGGVKKLFLAAACPFAMATHAFAADRDHACDPLLKAAEDAFQKQDYPTAIADLTKVRDMAVKAGGANDTRTLHAQGLLVRALNGAGQYEQAIGEGIAPLHAFSTPET